jgi:hypothetical protein
MITPHARRPPNRHRHLPLHGCRGLDEAPPLARPGACADALAEHRHLIREACVAEDGVEVDTQGDAFFFAFPTAPGALAATAVLTEALAPGPIHVRVGLHTGTPLVTARQAPNVQTADCASVWECPLSASRPYPGAQLGERSVRADRVKRSLLRPLASTT